MRGTLFALLLIVTGCAGSQSPLPTSAGVPVAPAEPIKVFDRPDNHVEIVRQLVTVLRDERANRKAFGR